MLSLLPACADDSGGTGESGSSSSTGADTSTTASTTVSTTQTTTISTTADTSDSASSSSADAGSSSTGAEPVEVTAEVQTFEEQPMVADLELTLSAPGTAEVTHASDAGVVISPAGGGDDTHLRFRVRGLTPELSHTLHYDVTPAGGGPVTSGDVDFDTPPPLAGFVAGFELETTDVDPAPLYRLFDYNPFPIGDFAGAIEVDPAGITRWFMSSPTTLAGPPAVWVAVRLRDDGTFLYINGDTFWIRDEMGTVLTELHAADMGLHTLHHDVIELANGNFLALSQSFRDVDYPDLGTQYTVGDLIVEFTPDGDVVWTWDCFDHLDPQRRRENGEDLIVDPLNGENALDWTHANAVLYDEATDVVTMSMRHQDWIISIDRASGDVLWRLGDEGDFTLDDGERWFFHQHAPQWQDDGTLLIYDNGNGNPYIDPLTVHTRAVRFALDTNTMIATVPWQDDESFFQVLFAGDADRIEGGHILVTDAAMFGAMGQVTARIRELDESQSPMRIWSITTPMNRWAYRTTAQTRLVGMPAR